MKTVKTMWSQALAAAFAVSLTAGFSQAAPLNLQLGGAPDLFSGFIDVTYDAGSDTLTASGFALDLDDDGVGLPHAIVNGTFLLVAPINAAGELGAGGTLVIGGQIPTLGMNSGTLLTGDITAFGFRPGDGDPLEFEIAITGGDVAALFGAARGGIILSATGFTGGFASDFNNLESDEPGTGAGAADVAPIRDPSCRAGSTKKGSLLVFSKVEIKWSADGQTLLQDTFLEVTNDYPDDVQVQAYFINGDIELPELCADELCETVLQDFEPGWNTADCRFTLTANQPHSWSAAHGSSKCQAFGVMDRDGPGRPDPETDMTSRVLRGFVVMWAVKFNPDAPDSDGRGVYEKIRWNHLEGSGVLVNYATASAWEYNAWAFPVCTPLVPEGGFVGAADLLVLDGKEYASSHSTLLFDFYAAHSSVLSGPGISVVVETDLTLHPVDLDLRQDGCGPLLTKVVADIWNENESKFSGTRRCICCWDQTMISQWVRSAAVPNHFLRSRLGTDKGKARLDAVASTACNYRDICGLEPQRGEGCVVTAGGRDAGFSQDTPLLGLMTKFLVFNGVGEPQRASAGTNLIGMGEEAAMIRTNVLYGPYERHDGRSGREAATGTGGSPTREKPTDGTKGKPSNREGRR